eukprot:472414-Pyramimonas_sp.AAC.1
MGRQEGGGSTSDYDGGPAPGATAQNLRSTAAALSGGSPFSYQTLVKEVAAGPKEGRRNVRTWRALGWDA